MFLWEWSEAEWFLFDKLWHIFCFYFKEKLWRMFKRNGSVCGKCRSKMIHNELLQEKLYSIAHFYYVNFCYLKTCGYWMFKGVFVDCTAVITNRYFLKVCGHSCYWRQRGFVLFFWEFRGCNNLGGSLREEFTSYKYTQIKHNGVFKEDYDILYLNTVGFTISRKVTFLAVWRSFQTALHMKMWNDKPNQKIPQTFCGGLHNFSADLLESETNKDGDAGDQNICFPCSFKRIFRRIHFYLYFLVIWQHGH